MEFPGNPPLTAPAGLTSDERTMAALSHLLGTLIALIVYFTQREKSKYVRFQALQAIVFDLAVMVITFVFVMVIMVLFFVVLALTMGLTMSSASNYQNDPTGISFLIVLMTLVPMLPFCIILPYVVVLMILKFLAAIQTLQGKDFRYPVIGKLVEQWSRD